MRGRRLLLILLCAWLSPALAGRLPTVTLLWDHAPGPYSYNVYSSTNPPAGWLLLTNVPGLSVVIPVAGAARFFAVTCVDTNTGLESAGRP